jgi:hypothetical protein
MLIGSVLQNGECEQTIQMSMRVSTFAEEWLVGTFHPFQASGFFTAYYSKIIRFATPSYFKKRRYIVPPNRVL